jgi:periplasmic protein TonB
MARMFKGVSIVIHAIVIAIASYLQVFDPGLLPTPRSALAFEPIALVAKDIPLPPAPRPPSTAAAASTNAAPVTPPSAITPETRHEADPPDPVWQGIERVEGGTGTIPGMRLLAPPPPPAPPPAPTKPIPLGGDIQRPVKTFSVEPVYPEIARAARKEGVVILEVVIATNGAVESVRVLRGVPMLDQAAVAAVQLWRFEPARLNGQAVPVVMTVTINFQLAR